MGHRIRRLFTAVSLVALCASLIIVAGDPAAANSDCDQRDPQADAFITIPELTSSSLHAIVTNLGPCNVADAVVSITLPVGSVVSSVSTNPTGYGCVGVGSNAISCPGPALKAPTIGVPGNHDFYLTFTLSDAADQTITAQVTLGGGAIACTDGSRKTTCDTYADNNVVWAAAIPAGAGGSLTTCAVKPCQQYADILVGTGGTSGTVQTQLLGVACPPAFPNCFGKLVSISSQITGALWVKTFTIDLSLAHGPLAGIHLINSTNGSAWTIVPLCSDVSTLPCIQSRSLFTVGGVTYKQFIVNATDDDSWGFDG